MLVLAVPMALCLVAIVPAVANQEDKPESSPVRYERILGPFPIDGHDFSVKLNVICYKESQHEGMCDDDDEETISSFKIGDENGKTRFSKSFPISLAHSFGRHLVYARLLEGKEQQALELRFETLPSRPNTGESIQLFALRNGLLKPLDREPLEFQGGLADLPVGKINNSYRLLENDTLPIFVRTNYFYIVVPIRMNWVDFRLEQQESGDFEIADTPPYQVRPDIESDRPIRVYASPDVNAKPATLDLTPQSHVDLLSARFAAAPPDENDSPAETWLKVRIGDRVGWILGVDDYTALGLSTLD
jgi:hypothetical protein